MTTSTALIQATIDKINAVLANSEFAQTHATQAVLLAEAKLKLETSASLEGEILANIQAILDTFSAQGEDQRASLAAAKDAVEASKNALQAAADNFVPVPLGSFVPFNDVGPLIQTSNMSFLRTGTTTLAANYPQLPASGRVFYGNDPAKHTWFRSPGQPSSGARNEKLAGPIVHHKGKLVMFPSEIGVGSADTIAAAGGGNPLTASISADGGVTWTRSAPVAALTMAARCTDIDASPTKIIAVIDGRAYMSTDGGQTWAIVTALQSVNITNVSYRNGRWFLYHTSTVWTLYTAGDADAPAFAQVAVPTGGSSSLAIKSPQVAYGEGTFMLLAQNGGSTQGIVRSTDGVSWTSVAPPVTLSNSGSGTSWSPLNVFYFKGAFYAIYSNNGTNSDRVGKSTDKGVTWTYVPEIFIGSVNKWALDNGEYMTFIPTNGPAYTTADMVNFSVPSFYEASRYCYGATVTPEGSVVVALGNSLPGFPIEMTMPRGEYVDTGGKKLNLSTYYNNNVSLSLVYYMRVD